MTNSVDDLWKVKFITLFFVLKEFELPVILFALKASNLSVFILIIKKLIKVLYLGYIFDRYCVNSTVSLFL